MYKLIVIISIFLLNCNTITKNIAVKEPSKQIQEQLTGFTQSDWETVYKAKDSLMVIQKDVIPHFINLMNNEKEFVRLNNTADLIYPGAEKFYGHGWFIPYDLDWIAIRAGWALEELTFQNFGFIDNTITKIDLIQFHKDNYEEYIQNGKHEINFERESFKKLNTSIKKATNWWFENQENWSNLDALRQAIYSNDEHRQIKAIEHLRHPNYITKGLTNEYFEKELLSRIKTLTLSNNEAIAKQAQYKIEEYLSDFNIEDIIEAN